MDNGLTYNNLHTNALGLEVSGVSRPLLPERRDEFIEIPKRNGSIHIPDKTLKDIEIPVSFILEPFPGETHHDACRRIVNWLLVDTWEKLIFDDDPNYYYEAIPVGHVDKEQISKYGEFTITFRCNPIMKVVGT